MLSHPNMKFPSEAKIYSMNEGNFNNCSEGVQNFVKYAQTIDNDTNRPLTARYIGSLVADFHRNIIKGGIYIYPSTFTSPNGKLRLLYECNPMAFIAEQAGGKASDGKTRIMDITPTELHQRVPLFTGNTSLVATAESFLK